MSVFASFCVTICSLRGREWNDNCLYQDALLREMLNEMNLLHFAKLQMQTNVDEQSTERQESFFDWFCLVVQVLVIEPKAGFKKGESRMLSGQEFRYIEDGATQVIKECQSMSRRVTCAAKR